MPLRWYQYSLRSLLVATAVTCATLGINTQVPRRLEPNSLLYGACATETGYGFPWVYSTTVCGFLVRSEREFHWFSLFGDIVVWFTMVFVTIRVAEWAIARIQSATHSKDTTGV